MIARQTGSETGSKLYVVAKVPLMQWHFESPFQAKASGRKLFAFHKQSKII